ncbi:MAG TPA: hypothetical protein VK733_04120 [Gemmatimonadaceae bacterium]|nr:hypothetical protein [Gemmatimonadaceae bacterium]
MPTHSETVTIAEYAEAEEQNREASIHRLSDVADLPDQIEDLYQCMSDFLPRRASRDTAQYMALWMLCTEVRNEFIQIVLAALRCHRSASFRGMRRAIELTGQSWLLHNRLDLVDVWWQREQSDAGEKAAKDAFKVTALFPTSDQVVTPIYERYQLKSRFVHPSLLSLAGGHRVDALDEGHQMVAEYFELPGDDTNEPLRNVVYACDTHLKLLDVFMRIFEQELAPNRPTLHVRFNAILARLQMQIAKVAER